MSITLKNELKKIEQILQPLQRENPFSFDMYKTQFIVWHIPMPQLRDMVNDGLFTSLSQQKEITLWRYIWQNTQIIEVRMAVLIRLKNSLLNNEVLWKQLQWFAKQIENWWESDFISEIIARLFEASVDDSIEQVLRQWNKSNNPWLQRQSIVSLFYYQRLRKRYPDFDLVKEQVEPLISHDFWYIQRAVGWTLRESLQVYPSQTVELLIDNVSVLPSIAWSTALEKCPTTEKEKLKKLRKIIKN